MPEVVSSEPRFCLNGNGLLCGLESGVVVLLSSRDGSEQWRIAAHDRPISDIAISDDGTALLTSQSDPGIAKLWRLTP